MAKLGGGRREERTKKTSGFCVMLFHCGDREQYEPYFGQGTKLTVLDNTEKTDPTVKVFRPSSKECRNQKDNERKKTILCVASKFYPDHISVFWQINGKNVSKGVATDNAALKAASFYSITSRLRVSAEDWFNPQNNFTCTVSFFTGNETRLFSDVIYGEAEDVPMTRERYLKITQGAKLSYAVFIIKSIIYGAFVTFLVWKLQGLTGKGKD